MLGPAQNPLRNQVFAGNLMLRQDGWPITKLVNVFQGNKSQSWGESFKNREIICVSQDQELQLDSACRLTKY